MNATTAVGNDGIADRDGAGRNLLEACDTTECGRLAAAAWTKQRIELAFRHLEADVLDSSEGPLGRRVILHQRRDLQHSITYALLCFSSCRRSTTITGMTRTMISTATADASAD